MEKGRARPRPLSLVATRAGIACALAALTLAVFVQIRDHDFVDYDDYVYVVHNQLAEAEEHNREALRLEPTLPSARENLP